MEIIKGGEFTRNVGTTAESIGLIATSTFAPDMQRVGTVDELVTGGQAGRHDGLDNTLIEHGRLAQSDGPDLPPLTDFFPDVQPVGDMAAVTRGGQGKVREDEYTGFRGSVVPTPFSGLEPLPSSA